VSVERRRRVRDVDVAGRAQLTKIVTWSALGGVVGGLLGVFGSVQGVWGAREIALFAGLGWAISFTVPYVVMTASGSAARVLSTPSGRSTPRKQGFSHAESLAARGMFEDGIAAFEVAIASDPADPTPYLEIARIYRDRLGRYEEAAQWLKRALRDATLSVRADAFARRELVELYVTRMREPAKAAPILAKMAEELRGTPEGDWASAEYERVRATVRGDQVP